MIFKQQKQKNKYKSDNKKKVHYLLSVVEPS
jgi:hypothetical protein